MEKNFKEVLKNTLEAKLDKHESPRAIKEYSDFIKAFEANTIFLNKEPGSQLKDYFMNCENLQGGPLYMSTFANHLFSSIVSTIAVDKINSIIGNNTLSNDEAINEYLDAYSYLQGFSNEITNAEDCKKQYTDVFDKYKDTLEGLIDAAYNGLEEQTLKHELKDTDKASYERKYQSLKDVYEEANPKYTIETFNKEMKLGLVGGAFQTMTYSNLEVKGLTKVSVSEVTKKLIEAPSIKAFIKGEKNNTTADLDTQKKRSQMLIERTKDKSDDLSLETKAIACEKLKEVRKSRGIGYKIFHFYNYFFKDKNEIEVLENTLKSEIADYDAKKESYSKNNKIFSNPKDVLPTLEEKNVEKNTNRVHININTQEKNKEKTEVTEAKEELNKTIVK